MLEVNFAFWDFSEVRFKRILRTSPFGDSRKFRIAPVLCNGTSYVKYRGFIAQYT